MSKQIDASVLDKTVGEVFQSLNLSERTRAALTYADWWKRSLRQLVAQSEGEILKIHNLGRKSLNEIKECLLMMNLWLGMSQEDIDRYSESEVSTQPKSSVPPTSKYKFSVSGGEVERAFKYAYANHPTDEGRFVEIGVTAIEQGDLIEGAVSIRIPWKEVCRYLATLPTNPTMQYREFKGRVFVGSRENVLQGQWRSAYLVSDLYLSGGEFTIEE